MSAGTIISIVVILFIIGGVIGYIIVNNNKMVDAIKEQKTMSDKLGASLANTQEILKNSVATKTNVTDIQNNVINSLDQTKVALSDSILDTQNAIELESDKRVNSINATNDRIESVNTSLQNSIVDVEAKFNAKVDNVKDVIVEGNQMILGGIQYVGQEVLNGFDVVQEILTEESIDRATAQNAIADAIAKEAVDRATGDIDVRNQINTVNNTLASTFGTEYPTNNIVTITRSPLKFASATGSYELNAGNDLNMRLTSTNSVNGFTISGSDNVMKHRLDSRGTATHIGGLRINDTNCVELNANNTNKKAQSSQVCFNDAYGANDNVMSIYGSAALNDVNRKMRLYDDVTIQNMLTVRNELRIGRYSLRYDPQTDKLVVGDDMNKTIAAFSSVPNTNRLEVYGNADGIKPYFYVGPNGQSQSLL